MMKELMELIKQKMITSATSIDQISSPNSDQYASQACLNLARTYEILNFLDKNESATYVGPVNLTAEYVPPKNSAEELSDKHWEECRQIALYDDELRQARELLILAKLLIEHVVMNEQRSPLLKDITEFLSKTEPNTPKEG